jgi:hypothetical protein
MGNLILRRNRPIREHQRIWQDYYVDKNLDDDWLEMLNSLSFYKMISICEGHFHDNNRPRGACPHINLRLKEQYMPLVISKFDQVSQILRQKLVELFGHENTYADIEFNIKIIASRSREEIRRDLVMHIHSRIARTREELDTNTKTWFQKIIKKVQEFDNFFSNILNG